MKRPLDPPAKQFHQAEEDAESAGTARVFRPSQPWHRHSPHLRRQRFGGEGGGLEGLGMLRVLGLRVWDFYNIVRTVGVCRVLGSYSVVGFFKTSGPAPLPLKLQPRNP